MAFDYSLSYKLLRIAFDVIDVGGAGVFMLVLFRINIRPVWFAVPAGGSFFGGGRQAGPLLFFFLCLLSDLTTATAALVSKLICQN